MNIHDGMRRKFLQNLFKPHHRQPREFRIEPDAKIQLRQFLVCMLIDPSPAVAYPVQGSVMAGNNFAILCWPYVKFYFRSPQRNGRPKGRHGILRRNGAKAPVRTYPGIGHQALRQCNRASSRAIIPGPSSLLHIRIMGLGRSTKSRWLVVLFLRIDLANRNTHIVFHINQHGSVRRYHHTGPAYFTIHA